MMGEKNLTGAQIESLGAELGLAIPLLDAIIDLCAAGGDGSLRRGSSLAAIETLAKTALRRVDRVAKDLGEVPAGQYAEEFERLGSLEAAV